MKFTVHEYFPDLGYNIEYILTMQLHTYINLYPYIIHIVELYSTPILEVLHGTYIIHAVNVYIYNRDLHMHTI